MGFLVWRFVFVSSINLSAAKTIKDSVCERKKVPTITREQKVARIEVERA